MRRILLVLTVALVMAAMLVASAMPAFAAPNCEGFKDGSTKELNGQHRAHNNAFDKFFETQDPKYSEQDDKHRAKEGACIDDVPPGEGQLP
jgi:hypothetical protein